MTPLLLGDFEVKIIFDYGIAADYGERWPGKTAQGDKWIFYLTAANGAA